MAESETFDAIVIGAGHNGLAAAVLLQKAGLRTVCVDSRTWRIGRVQFLNHRRLHKTRLTSVWEELADFAQCEIHNFGARLIDQRFRGTDHQFDVTPTG